MSALSPSEVLDVLDADSTTEKRAAWEGFEFTLLGDGEVAVVNNSHENPDEHTYTVDVVSGIPAHCTCPAWEYQEGPCKHMVGVAIREPLLEAVTAESPLRADGGVAVNEGVTTESEDKECNCGEFPCWPCYRHGRRELPE
jgi:hypothetical protein